MSYVFQMQKQANVPQYSLHSIALQNYRNRNANGYIYIYIYTYVYSFSTVQKLHVQQPGECTVLQHRFQIRLHLLRRHFKGEVFSVLYH